MDRLIDEALTRTLREEKRWKNEIEYERKEVRIMSRCEKIRKPIKRARLKHRRQAAPNLLSAHLFSSAFRVELWRCSFAKVLFGLSLFWRRKFIEEFNGR